MLRIRLTFGHWEWRISLGLRILRGHTGASGRQPAGTSPVEAVQIPALAGRADHWKLIQHTMVSDVCSTRTT